MKHVGHRQDVVMPGASGGKKQRCCVVTTGWQCHPTVPRPGPSHNCLHYPPHCPPGTPGTPRLRVENIFMMFPRGQTAGEDAGTIIL